MADQVTVESLDSALDALIKAADATEALSKGDSNNIEHSGRNDENGKGGGGRTTATGGLDKMMIAKMAEAGIGAGDIAAFEAFMTGKAADEDEEEEDEDEGKMFDGNNIGAGGNSVGGNHGVKKSMDTYSEDPGVGDAIDVSAYLEGMTAKTADLLDAVRADLSKGFGGQANVNRAMALATHEVGQLVKSQAGIITEMGRRLNIVEAQPAPARGAATLQGAQAMHKSVSGEVGPETQSLSKSEMCSTLNYMSLEKGQRQIAGQRTSEAVCMLEGGAALSHEVEQAAYAFLATNPGEASQAKSYS